MTMPASFSQVRWRKSSHSNGNGGDCVEIAVTRDAIGVRDTKNREGGTLTFDPSRWTAFITTLGS